MAMMICDAFGGGGAVVSVVSVLCGAGGGLTVQPDRSVISANIAAMTRTGLGTLFRVSAAAEGVRPAGVSKWRSLPLGSAGERRVAGRHRPRRRRANARGFAFPPMLGRTGLAGRAA